MTPEITFTVGWSGDSLYCLEDVNRLYRMLKKHTDIPFYFNLYAGPEAQKPGKLDGIDANVHVVKSELPSWWAGMKALEPDANEIKTKSFITLGLDIVICGCLDPIIHFPSSFAAMKDWPSHHCAPGDEKHVNCEVVLYRNGSHERIWREYCRVGKPTWDMLTPPASRVWPFCQQGWLNSRPQPLHVDIFPEEWCCSYKLMVLEKGLPKDAKIVSFHGHPKPGEVQEQWVKENWM